jgi:hypothetical protein
MEDNPRASSMPALRSILEFPSTTIREGTFSYLDEVTGA